MSKQTRYNQILFLMTLSVYMGLVLAGGASPALAQAAMAKGFELKTELEVKDDLDKKPPEDQEDLHSFLDEYLANSADFLTTLHHFNQSKKFDADRDKFSVSKTRYTFCDQDRVDASFQWESESELEIILALSLKGKSSLADCIFNPQYQADQKTANTRLKVSYDKLFLKIEYSAKKRSQQSAEDLSVLLSNSVLSWKPSIDASFTKSFQENTKVISTNDQVFIVTNLPRAGLDELLAAK